jgi:hypothetical protein
VRNRDDDEPEGARRGPAAHDLREPLARIEAHLAAIRGALESAPRPAPARLGTALERLVVATWAAGLLALAAGSWIAGLEAWRNPAANVCASAEAGDYEECLVEPAPGEESLLASLRRLVAGAEVDPARVVRRYATEAHATSLRRLAGLAVAWSIAAACGLLLLVWVRRGLR